MTRLPPRHTPLAVMLSIALLAPAPVLAEDTSGECDPTTENCEENSSSKGWLWGGLAALGLGAAAAGGGGGGGGGGNGSGGGGGGATPPQEGGQYGNGHVLVGAGAQSQWQQGATTRVTGRARNEGELLLTAGLLQVTGGGELRNNGTLGVLAGGNLHVDGDADLDNYGLLRVESGLQLAGEGSLENFNSTEFAGASVQLNNDAEVDNHGSMQLARSNWALSGSADLDNGRNALMQIDGTTFKLRDRAEIENDGRIVARGTFADGVLFDAVTGLYGNDRDQIAALDNRGHIQLDSDATVLRLVADNHASHAVNRAGGTIQSSARHRAMLHADGAHATLHNLGTLTVTGDGSVAMRGTRGATLINDGVINLGTTTDNRGRGLVAMQSDGSATVNNRRGGVINIHAMDSFAFQVAGGGNGRLINNGVVNVYGQGSGTHADAATAAANRPGADLGWQAPRTISGYTVGTNADGSSGRLVLHDGGHLDSVAVDTGFTRGTDASQINLRNVVTGADSGEQNIRSASVVWQAQAERNGDGGIDVHMKRNDYRDLAGADQQQLASALEHSYRNGALFHSLEVANQAQFQNALRQLSGAGLVDSAMRVAANGDALWSQMSTLAPDQHRTLAFGGGQSNALGVRGNGTAVQVAMPLGGGQSLQLMTAMLDGDLTAAGGQDRNRSYFAGIGTGQQWGNLQLRHQFGYEQHRVQGERNLQWGQTSERVNSQRRLNRTLLTSTLSAEASVAGVRLQPRLKASAFDYREAAFSELHDAGFGLNVAAGRLSGMSMEAGSTLQRAFGQHWQLSADMALIKPIALNASDRQAWLSGAADQAFSLPGVRTQGLDHRMQVAVNYQRHGFAVGAQMLRQRLWGQTDTRAQLQASYRFK